jgi:hypothetical protein
VGAIPLNVQAKLDHDEDFALMIQATWARYVRPSMVFGWNMTRSLLNKIVWHKEIGFLT